ncbi:hypothetical protein ABL78_8051 [Leptomonas seymouri]|uniref:BTB domain-containing protein n=1 Tax=Leptomonas seymouri TaxID=5684 RepID=A0A0N1HZP2_LEPSE|nr:hypothetical protein ABL78_8051 [Leptomonas seymouri]|eukprot:KPI82931.1 hypothetical protein ABL78_8051 [Leptomonas seymouri]
MQTSSPPNTHHDDSGGEEDDVLRFVVEDGTRTLYFSKQRLMQHTPFFKTYFTVHTTAMGGSTRSSNRNTVVLKHVTGAAAEAALRLCHSRQQSDDGLFLELQAAFAKAETADQRREALRHLLSLYEACVKFEQLRHARMVGHAVAAAVTVATVLDVLKTCARYTCALPQEVREKIGLRPLLAACWPCIPAAWTCSRDDRRWRRLCAQCPELPAMLEAAAAGSEKTDVIVVERRGVPHLLLSPQRDEVVNGVNGLTSDLRDSSDMIVLKAQSTAPSPAAALEDVFTHHLQQTEELALAAQRRRRAMEIDVAALRADNAALHARVHEDEATAAASTRYLGNARVYVQALRAAESDMRALCAVLALVHDTSPTSTMHVLRHELHRVAEHALKKRNSIDELIALEGDALSRLDKELADMRSELSQTLP